MILVKDQLQASASNQTICYEVVNSPDRNPRCRQSGLDMNVYWVIKCGDIMAYKLLWFTTGEWSDWFVTNVNDLSTTSNNSSTRM